MTYGRYTPERFEPIRDITTRLESSSPGEKITISGIHPDDLTRIRSLLYAWLHLTGVKRRFRILTDPPNLIIKHLGTPALSLTINSSSLVHLEPLIEEIIDNCDTVSQAEEIVNEWLSSKTINIREAMQLIEKIQMVLS